MGPVVTCVEVTYRCTDTPQERLIYGDIQWLMCAHVLRRRGIDGITYMFYIWDGWRGPSMFRLLLMFMYVHVGCTVHGGCTLFG